MSEIQIGEHKFLSGGHAYDAAQDGNATAEALIEVVKALPERLNPSDVDHSDHVDTFWQGVIDHADSLGYTPTV